jgi:hypothetical protein
MGQRTAKSTARQMRNELIPEWGSRPITEITRDDVVTLIEMIADRPGAPGARAYSLAVQLGDQPRVLRT